MAFVFFRSVFGLWLGAAVGCCPAAASSAPHAAGPGHHDATARASSAAAATAAFDQSVRDTGDDDALPAELRRQAVSYPTRELPGTIVIDTPHTYLYYVLGDGQAIRYPIGVGREGFTWSGMQRVSRKAIWPSWAPPREMIKRQQYLPHWVAGGPDNPLGARALYLGDTEYRIHGTNDPTTIGQNMSSGCIRLTNEDIIDLYDRTGVGTKVVVLAQAPADDDAGADDPRVSSHPPSPQAASPHHALAHHALMQHALSRHTLARQAVPPREPSQQEGAWAPGAWMPGAWAPGAFTPGTTASSAAAFTWH
ncbi:MAG TPA: L,D-transpeptidase [Xanthobacteraceae bacterium]